jgi:hypothetical protein
MRSFRRRCDLGECGVNGVRQVTPGSRYVDVAAAEIAAASIGPRKMTAAQKAGA